MNPPAATSESSRRRGVRTWAQVVTAPLSIQRWLPGLSMFFMLHKYRTVFAVNSSVDLSNTVCHKSSNVVLTASDLPATTVVPLFFTVF